MSKWKKIEERVDALEEMRGDTAAPSTHQSAIEQAELKALTERLEELEKNLEELEKKVDAIDKRASGKRGKGESGGKAKREGDI